jgi:hypothetical protein
MLSKQTNQTFFTQIYIYTLCTLSTITSLQSTCHEHNIYIVLSNLTIAIITHTFCKHDSIKTTLFAIITALCYTLTTFIFTIQTHDLNIKCEFYQQSNLGLITIWSHTIAIVIPAGLLFIVIGFILRFIDKNFI